MNRSCKTWSKLKLAWLSLCGEVKIKYQPQSYIKLKQMIKKRFITGSGVHIDHQENEKFGGKIMVMQVFQFKFLRGKLTPPFLTPLITGKTVDIL